MSLLWLPSRLKSLFCNRLWSSVGVVSYSVYLWHNPVLVYWMRFVAPGHAGLRAGLLGGGGAMALSLLVSVVSYRLIEQPFLKHRSRGWRPRAHESG
jgi:peptidoglycan/LPS O-acetylase OafA/YrhL